ncbi:MAG: hypothetical protein NVSMB24_21210 [Mucilaginibacter sp.]
MTEAKNPNEYRGYFIHEFAKMEYEIDYYLASYFVGESPMQNDLISILIDRIPFESKTKAFKTLLDIKYPKENGKHGKSFKKLLDEIGKSARLRNQFAHYHSVNFITDGLAIALFEFRDTPKMIQFSITDFNAKIDSIRSCALEIGKLRKKNYE